MDCQTALQILDVASLGPDQSSPPEVAEARAHIESHAECARIYRGRLRFDRQVAHVMQDVPDSPGLKDRLLAAVTQAAVPSSPVASEPASPAVVRTVEETSLPRRGRRLAVFAAMGVSAAILAGLGFWSLFSSVPAPVEFAQLRAELATSLPADLQLLPAWSGSEAPPLPRGWNVASIRIDAARRLDGPAEVDIAVYSLQLTSGGRQRSVVHGVLLVLPLSSVANPPQAADFSAQRNVTYVGQNATVAWTSGEWVYVCVAPAAGNVLNRFEQAMATPLS